MKKLIVCTAVLALLLCGCADLFPNRTTLPAVVDTKPVSEAEDTGPIDLPVSPAPMGNARYDTFRMALDTVHNDRYLPVLAQQVESYESIENEDFAIYDVDGDGKEELLVRISDTYMAGMLTVIYGFNEESGALYTELTAFPALSFYPGLIKESASHNHGKAGEVLWPYHVHRYDPTTDTYTELAYADAWSKEFDSKDFPEALDTDHVGAVFLITENGQTRTVSYSDFLAWETPLFAGLPEIKIPWQKLTNANIAAATFTQPAPEATVHTGYLWQGKTCDVTAEALPGRLEIRDAGTKKLLVVAAFPDGMGQVQTGTFTFEDLTDDGYSDISADFTLTDGSHASILWMSDGESLSYNEEFSVLPGQVGPKGSVAFYSVPKSMGDHWSPAQYTLK